MYFQEKSNLSPIIWSISRYVSFSIILKLHRFGTVLEMWASQKENYRDFGLYLCPSWPFFKPQTSYSAAAGSSYLPPRFSTFCVRGVRGGLLFTHIQMGPEHAQIKSHKYVCLHSKKKCLRAPAHIKVVSGGNLKSMSWYLESAGNTYVKCEHIWVTKTNTHFITS